MIKDNSKIEKKDWIIILLLILPITLLSFYKLGDNKVPKTYQFFPSSGYHASITLEKEEKVKKIRYYSGNKTGEFVLMSSIDGTNYEEVTTFESNSVFAWEDIELDIKTKNLQFISKTSSSTLGDIMLYGNNNEKIKIIKEKNNPIIDEQNLVPKEISYLNSTYFDEIYYARTAYEYAMGIDAFEWSHPPLGKLIMTIPVYLFGFSPFTYRLMSTLFGILLIPIMYIITKKIFKKRKWAILGALLMIFDTFRFAHTRIALIDSFQLVFVLLSVLMLLIFIENNPQKRKYRYLLLSGLFFGCSIATKWNAAYISIALGIFLLKTMIEDYSKINDKKKYYLKLILLCILSFIIIPLIIYILSYLLFPNLSFYDKTLTGINKLTKMMYNYHSSLTELHPFSSKWYEWPIMLRPLWLYTSDTINGIRRTIVDIGNPAIWWFGIISFIYVLISTFKKNKENTTITILVLSTFIPYILVNRPMFIYHYFITLPFIMLGIVSFIKYLSEKLETNSLYYIYIIVISLFFFIFYPVVSGIPVSENYINTLRWFSSWIF